MAEPKKRTSVVEMKRAVVAEEKVRAAHAANFLECVRTHKSPVENLDLGHHVSRVAHLGNLALRSRGRIEGDAQAQRVAGNEEASRLLSRNYSAPANWVKGSRPLEKTTWPNSFAF